VIPLIVVENVDVRQRRHFDLLTGHASQPGALATWNGAERLAARSADQDH
jgi:hypothetical protein